ncbi:Butyrophilin-like protein 2 [Channa argus]|uniref:Butyrophilin-like protein 2 n=1 Tax=Channa argus TaxID=215402 RepID=A0A6G1Q828_CHAAH|nr:Butyrophilin-like protein 2 [Channa argus]
MKLCGFCSLMMFVVFVILLFVSQHALSVEVYEGQESVLLVCQVSVSVSQRSTVVWSREELKNPEVHVRQPSGDDHTDQNQRYTDRTSMRTDALQTGDLSLTLTKPTISDSDTYTCTVRRMGELLSQTEEQLLVRERPPPVWPWVLVLIILLLLAALCLFVYVAYTRMKKRRADFQVGIVEVTEGVESVLLPFKPTVNLSGNIRVKWSRSDSEPVTVHVCQNGRNEPHKQDEAYRGRTEMKEDLLKGGDLSLTLSKPCRDDRGVYVCTIYKNGKFLTQKKVALCVRAFQVATMEVTEGVESVLLPCKITAGLPEDVTVEWKVTVPKPMMVHVYQNNQTQPDKQHEVYRGRTEMKKDPMQTGDLSLTLSDPRVDDGGVYICAVYRDGETLQQKRVALCVKVCQVEKVEITEGVKTALLPFQTRGQLPEDVTVEWRRSDPKPMVVHLFQNGQNQPDTQDEVYRGRTEMKTDPMGTGDLSLTLRKPQFDDGGVYICTVYTDGETLAQKIVVLCIQEDWKTTMELLYQDDGKKNNTTLHQLLGFIYETVDIRNRSSSTDSTPLMAVG